jgi:hypothetical protein
VRLRLADLRDRAEPEAFDLADCAKTAFWSRPTRSSAGNRSLFILVRTNGLLRSERSRFVSIQTAVLVIIGDLR